MICVIRFCGVVSAINGNIYVNYLDVCWYETVWGRQPKYVHAFLIGTLETSECLVTIRFTFMVCKMQLVYITWKSGTILFMTEILGVQDALSLIF